MRVGEPGVLCERKLANQVVGKSPPWCEWKQYVGFTLDEGWHYCDYDLQEVRDEYLRRGDVPRQSLSDFTNIRQLTIGKTVIQRVPKDCWDIEMFTSSLGMPWAGEGLPSVCQKALF